MASFQLMDLPLELFKPILAEAVRIRGLKRALRLRLVNRRFSEELIEALCTSGLSSECDVALSQMPFVRPYLEQRLLEHRADGLVLLNTVQKTAEELAIRDGDPAKFEEYAPKLLELAAGVCKHEVCQLLFPGPGYWDPEGFHYEILTAAAYTNNMSLVKEYMGWCLGWKAGILGNPYQAAVAGRHFDILTVLFTDVYWLSMKQRYELLQQAAENGDKEMVDFILHAEWSPCKHSLSAGATTEDLETALRTPSIEIFDLIMRERTKFYKRPLTQDAIERLLHEAVTRNWVDMTRHITSPGETAWSLGKSRVDEELFHACKMGHSDIVKLLLSQVHIRGAEDRAQEIKRLLEHPLERVSYVAVAAASGHLGVVRMLLDAGINPNAGIIDPMPQAVLVEHPGICQLLSERGATTTVAQAVVTAAQIERMKPKKFGR